MQTTGNNNTVSFDLKDTISLFSSVLKRRWKILLLLYFALLSITFVYNFNKRTAYQTTFIINYSGLSSAESKATLEYFCEMKRDDSSARSTLKQMEVLNKDADSIIKVLNLSMSLYDSSYAEKYIKELLDFSNKSYIVQPLDGKREKISQVRKDYTNQLDQLLLYSQKMEKENSTLQFNIYRDIAYFKEKILNLDYELLQLKESRFSVISSSPFKIAGFSLIKTLMLAGILGIIVCPFLIFFFDKLLTTSNKE